MYRVVAMGDKESIYGFAALGLDVVYPENFRQAQESFKKLIRSNYAVIYITEELAESLEEEIEKFSYKSTPAIIRIPGVKGNTGKGMMNVKKSVEKAVGSDIVFND